VSGTAALKTMRLRYAGVCAGCSRSLARGEPAHYLRASKAVRCLPFGSGSTRIALSMSPWSCRGPSATGIATGTDSPLDRAGAGHRRVGPGRVPPSRGLRGL
jgi:hypothetical protein